MKKIIMVTCLFISGYMAHTQVNITYTTDDTSSVGNIINAMYNVISGPAGQRNWSRFKNLFTNDAKMGAIYLNRQNVFTYTSFSTDDYIKNNDSYFLKNGFFEKEIHRTTNTFGNLVNVFTTYESESGGTKQRGINSLQLVYFANRWWIASLIWEGESEKNPIPKEFLNE